MKTQTVMFMIGAFTMGAVGCSASNDDVPEGTGAPISAPQPSAGSNAPADSVPDSAPDSGVAPEPEQSAAQTIVSTDGLATLKVAAGAVPADVEITLDIVDGPAGSVGAWEVGPAGTTFDAPATFEVTVDEPAADLAYALAFLAEDGPVPGPPEVGTDSNSFTFNSEVPEAGVIFISAARLELRQTQPDMPVPVGNIFNFEVSLTSDFQDAELLGIASVDPRVVNPIEPDGYRGLLEVVCPDDRATVTIGDALGIVHIPSEPIDHHFISLPLVAECVDEPQETALAFEPPDSTGAGLFDSPVTIAGTDEGVVFTFMTEAIPEGGTLGLGFETDSNYTEYFFEARSTPTSAACQMFDFSGNGTGEDIDFVLGEQRSSFTIPTDHFVVIDNTLNRVVDGAPQPVAFISVDAYAVDGSRDSAILPPGQIVDLAETLGWLSEGS